MKVPTVITPRTRRASGETPFIQNRAAAGPASSAALGNSIIQAANAVGSVGGLLREQAMQAQRFGVLQNFSAFQLAVDERMAELKRNADPAQGNFADQATAMYSNWEADWLKTVPDEFYDEFATRAADVKTRVARDALAFQYERTDEFFRQGVTDQLNRSLLSLDQNGSLENLDAQRAAIDEYIDSTTLTEAEKLALRRQAYKSIESVSYKTEVRRGNLEVGALGVGASTGTAIDLIREFDGALLENGLDYETNQELLTARVEEASAGALAAIGSIETWEALPPRAQAVLTSVYDDLGELPPSVVEAVASGDLEAVASAIQALGGDRREAEAQILLGTADMPEGQLDADPRFANIPYEDRLALRADAEREAAAIQTAEQKAAQAQQEAAINGLMVDLFDGNAGQFAIDQAREEGWLTDYEDIKRAQSILDDRTAGLAMVQQMQAMIATGMTINPGSEADQKMFNTYIGEEGLAALRQRNPDFVAQVLVPAVRSAGDLPTETVGLLTGMLRSSDPMQALFALDTLSQLEQASPEAYNARVTEAVAGDVEYWRSIKDFYPQEEVLAAVRGGTTQEERTRVTMLREQARDLINDGSIQTNIVSVLGDAGGWRPGDPMLTAGQSAMLNADFQSLFEREYARDGNQAAAEQRAIKALGRVWGTTDVGGQQLLMRYPPEKLGYETWNGSYDWITEQGRAELGLEPNQTFQLISDEQTRAEFQAWKPGAGSRPSYLVVYTDAEGQLRMPLDENGQPQRMFFEITEEMNAEKAAMLNQAQQAQAYTDFMVMYNQAQQHSLRTGTPIPPDIEAQYERWQANPPIQAPNTLAPVRSVWGGN